MTDQNMKLLIVEEKDIHFPQLSVILFILRHHGNARGTTVNIFIF